MYLPLMALAVLCVGAIAQWRRATVPVTAAVIAALAATTVARNREYASPALLAKSGYSSYGLPKLGMDCAVGDYAVRLSSYLQPKGVGTYLRTHVGRVPRFDNAKIQKELGLRFRPIEDTILETVADVVQQGHVPAKSGGPAPATT